jgi:hypothetical protein
MGSMGELLVRYGGTAFALAPDDEECPLEPNVLVQHAFAAGAETVLAILRKRALDSFAAAIPALDALLVEVGEVRTCDLSDSAFHTLNDLSD